MYCCRPDAELFRILEKRIGISAGDDLEIDSFFTCPVDDFVIHISDVDNIVHLIIPVFEITAEYIEHDKRPCISDVKKIVNSRAACIEVDLVAL